MYEKCFLTSALDEDLSTLTSGKGFDQAPQDKHLLTSLMVTNVWSYLTIFH